MTTGIEMKCFLPIQYDLVIQDTPTNSILIQVGDCYMKYVINWTTFVLTFIQTTKF